MKTGQTDVVWNNLAGGLGKVEWIRCHHDWNKAYFHPMKRNKAFKQWNNLYFDTQMHFDVIDIGIWSHTGINLIKENVRVTIPHRI